MTLRLTCILILFSSLAQAQYPSSFIHSNYGGVQSMLFNPALVADSRVKLQVQLASLYVNAQNNYLQIETPYNQFRGLRNAVDEQYLDENGYTSFSRLYLNEKLNGRKKFASVQAEIQGPGILYSSKYGSFGFSMRSRALVHASGIDENLLKIFTQDADTLSPNWDPNGHQLRALNQQFSQGNMSLGAMAFQQFGFTYANTANTRPKNQWSYGVSLHYLIGLGAAQLDVESLDYNLLGLDSIQFDNVDIRASYTSGDYYNDATAGKLLGSDKLGGGMAIDFGVSYEWRPQHKRYRYRMDRRSHDDPTANKYVFKAAASIVDFGRIKYDKPGTTKRYNLYSEAPVVWTDFNSAENVTSEEKLDSFLFDLFPDSDTTSKFISRLPTSLNLLVDYQILPKWYVGLNYVQSLRTRGVDGVKKPNRLTVHTRYEGRHLEAGFQITVRNSYSPVQLGSYVRLGPVFIGTEHLATFLMPKKTSAMNVYGGITIPLYKKRIKDTDLDGCSDAMDKCPKEAGSPYAHGCPDMDEDGIADYKDDCPFTFGNKSTKGCPDTDEDGIADKNDSCAQTFGYAQYNGCPDQGYVSEKPSNLLKNDSSKHKVSLAQKEKKNTAPLDSEPKLQEKKEKPKPVASKPIPENPTPEELIEYMELDTFEYYLIFGVYKTKAYAENLIRDLSNRGVTASLKFDPEKKLYYVTTGSVRSKDEAKNVLFTYNTPSVLGIINGHLWWKKWDKT